MRSRSAFSSASPARWSAPAIAPNRRSHAITRGWARAASRAARDPGMSTPFVESPIALRWLGQVDYEPTWRDMQRRTDTAGPDTADEIWFLEHPPVFTMAMNAKQEHLLAPG